MRRLSAILMSLLVLFAPGCQLTEALGNYSDSEKELTDSNLELAQARAKHAAEQKRSAELEARLAEVESELANAPDALTQALLLDEVEGLRYDLNRSDRRVTEAEAKEEAAAVAQAKAEGEAQMAKMILDQQGQVTEQGAAIFGGPQAAALTRVGVLLAGGGAAAWGRARAVAG